MIIIMRKNQKGLADIILVLTIVVLLGVVVFIFFQNRQTDKVADEAIPIDENVETEWNTISSDLCDVTFTIPPKEEPYYFKYDPDREPSVTEDVGSGRFWDYKEGSGTLFMTDNTATAVFVSSRESSGYVAGGVFVYCTPNVDGYDNKQLVAAIKDYIAENINSETAQVFVKVIKEEDGQMWNRSVKAMRFEGLMFNPEIDYYVFATDDKIFIVNKQVQSETEIVQETTDKIFTSLLFGE